MWILQTTPGKQEKGWSCHPCKKYHPLYWNPKIQSKWHRISWSRTCPTRSPLASFQHLPPPPPSRTPPPPPPQPPTSPSLFTSFSPPQKTGSSWEILNSHSPSWGFDDLEGKGKEVESWATKQQLILINKPWDSPTFYSRSWITTTTPIWHLQVKTRTSSATASLLSQGGKQSQTCCHPCRPEITNEHLEKSSKVELQEGRLGQLQAICGRRMYGTATAWGNINLNAIRATTQSSEQQKVCSQRTKKNYNPFWTPQLEPLQEAVNRARENKESNSSDQQNAAKPELSSQQKLSCRQRKSGVKRLLPYTRRRTQANSETSPQS